MATPAPGDHAARLALAYGGDVTGTYDLAQPREAAALLGAGPGPLDAETACALGDEATLRHTITADAEWVNRAGGPLKLPPLVAVTHSRMFELPEYRERLRGIARLLIAAGADPNASIGNRWPPASLAAPDESARLSALYGAAGVNRDLDMTALLLDAGANPNDGESLYHSLENIECTRLLLRRGARVAGTNAIGRALDMPDPEPLELLLANGGDANEAGSGMVRAWGSPLLRAIAVRCSAAHIRALLADGADPLARTPGGISAYRLARMTALADAAAMLAEAGAGEPLSEADQFVAACAAANATEAQRIKALRPDLPESLPPALLRLLPDTLAWGSGDAARLMVELGWPLAARGADWDATALNLAVFRGDAAMAAFLLARGADWRERHGFDDDVIGTLSWVSVNQPVSGGDWVACAQVLRAHGLPRGDRDPGDARTVQLAGQRKRFSAEVAQMLAS